MASTHRQTRPLDMVADVAWDSEDGGDDLIEQRAPVEF